MSPNTQLAALIFWPREPCDPACLLAFSGSWHLLGKRLLSKCRTQCETSILTKPLCWCFNLLNVDYKYTLTCLPVWKQSVTFWAGTEIRPRDVFTAKGASVVPEGTFVHICGKHTRVHVGFRYRYAHFHAFPRF